MTDSDALRHIKNAWIAGIISSVVTLIASLLPLFGASIAGFNLFNLADVALIAGLTVGIWRKSRICALIMLVYFIASKVMLISKTGNSAGLIMGAVFAYFYFQGVRGTFAWHKLQKETAGEPPVLPG